SYVNTNMGL
nr:Chain C, syvntnmgl [synthetic construct]